MSGPARSFKRSMDKEQDVQPIAWEFPRENMGDAYTLDPARATTIHLPPSFKLRQQETSRWPDGFWDCFYAAASHYNRGRYQRAKR